MVLILLLVFVFSTISAQTVPYSIPNVTIEASTEGKLRVHIPHASGINFVAFHANINEEIATQDAGLLFGETRTRSGNYWMLTFEDETVSVKKGDFVNYWIFVIFNRVGYFSQGSSEIQELQETFSQIGDCTSGSTTVNGEPLCIGKIIIDDEFSTSTIDRETWSVEQMIPTYTGPNFEFNSYKDRDKCRFIKDGVLYLKPHAINDEHEVRGEVNLTQKCTSDIPEECYFKQLSSFLLPPVISGKIKSKISFKYGKVEIRAKLPLGDWIYPMVELEPKVKIDGENSAKIWVAYSRGNDHLNGSNSEEYGSRILFGGPVLHPAEPGRSKALATRRAKVPFGNDFHNYTLEWRPSRMMLYVDGVVYGDISTSEGFADPSLGIGDKWVGRDAPFNKEYILSLGVAVGGINDFPDGFDSGPDPKPWSNEERNYIKNFFDARHVWMKTWKGDNPALKIDFVKITAV